MNAIFTSKAEFIEQYREAVRTVSGKEFEEVGDIDRFNALAQLVASRARSVASQTDARVRETGKSACTTSRSSS